jgi:cell division protease FtsH
MDPQARWNLAYWILAVLALVMLQNWWQTTQTVEQVPYSEFELALAEGRVSEVLVSEQKITGKLKSPDIKGKTVIVATRVEPDLAERLSGYQVPYSRVIESTFLRDVLSWLLPAVLFFAVWLFLFRRLAERQGMGGFMTIGKSRAKVYVQTDTGVTFDDVAGVDESKEELHEVVDFLKNPQDYGRLGAHIPKGVLLVGPPGTGKTLLAKAVAGEAGVPFFSISGSEFVEMFVGVGAARVRDLFEQAREKAPAIIFIDELDALGRARGAFAPMGGHDEREQTLNQLLAEMDGFDTSVGLIILAATNRPEILDPALLRAGRFDRQVLVDRPDKKGRVDILKVHVKKIKLAAEVDLEQVAALTTGFSGADIANLVNEAALLATRRRADAVTLDDFSRAVERIVAGLEKKNRVLNEHERETVAYHEMGHALVALALPGSDPGAQGLDHPARHRRARLHHPAPHRGPLSDDPRRAGKTRSPCCSAAAPRKSWCSASSPPGPPTTSPRPPTSPATWSPATAWTRTSATSPTRRRGRAFSTCRRCSVAATGCPNRPRPASTKPSAAWSWGSSSAPPPSSSRTGQYWNAARRNC